MSTQKERQEDFKDRLRRALDMKGMKAVDLCEKADVPKSAISYYLAGKSQPKADRLYKISVALGVSEAWLLGFNVPVERTPEQKKNDHLARMIVQLRKDPEFFDVVSALADLPAEQYASIKQLITALGKK